MYPIAMEEMSPEFIECWVAAGQHLNRQVQGGIQSWLRAHPYPPFLEHLSFRLGNQLFFVRVEDVSGRLQGPGSRQGLLAVADGNRGQACLLPMVRRALREIWTPECGGWGLVDARLGHPVDPIAMVTDEKIEMTDWELHDMAVQVVRDHLESRGYKIMSWQGNPGVDPSIWFVGDSGGPEWVVVRAAKYPSRHAARPENWAEISRGVQRMSLRGHFGSVAVASADQPFTSETEHPVPLWRGYGMYVNFPGLET